MKHYKSVDFCQILECQSPAQTQSPIEDLLLMML